MIRSFIKELLFLVTAVGLGFGAFILLFPIGLFSADPLVFRRGVEIALVVLVVQFLLLGMVRAGSVNAVQWSTALAGASLTFSVNIVFLIVVIVTIDRSVTMFLLGSLYKSDRVVSKSELIEQMESSYIRDLDAVGRRIEEQRLIGNVEVGDTGIALTSQGKNFIARTIRIAEAMKISTKIIQPVESSIVKPNARTAVRAEAPQK